MVRRKPPRRQTPSKRPSQTLDLKAEEVPKEDSESAAHETERAETEAFDNQADKESAALKSEIDSGEALEELDPSIDRDEPVKMGKQEDQMAKGSDKQDQPSSKITGRDHLAGDHPSSAEGSSGGSFFKMLAAGLIGAVLALGGQMLLWSAGPDPAGPLADVGLKDRIGKIEKKLAGMSADDLSLKLDQLASKIESGSFKEQNERLAKMEAVLADLAKGAQPGAEGIEGLAALATKLNEIEQRMSNRLSSLKEQVSQDFKQDLAKLSSTGVGQDQLVELEGVKLTAKELAKRLARIEAQSGQLAGKVEGLSKEIAAFRAELVSKTELEGSIGDLAAQMKAFEGNLARLKSIEKDAHETARQSALALALNNLKRAMARGDGFFAELEAVQRLMNDDGAIANDLEVLQRFASSGLSTEQALINEFPEFARAAIDSESVKEDAGFWDKALQQARHTFRYRRTGDIPGQSTEAVLARIEHNFKGGHLEQAVFLAKALDSKPSRVMAPWVTKLQARLAVEQAILKIEDQLQTGLGPRAD